MVFGAGGDRDRGKRPLMGKIAAELADVTIVTSDNPRSEEPLAIIQDVLQGAGVDVEIDPDRRSAIARAVSLADEGDVVVIAGKGHEQGQDVAGVVTPFDDREVVREARAGLGVIPLELGTRSPGSSSGVVEGGRSGALVTGVKADSRDAGPSDLFVALNTGVRYVEEARREVRPRSYLDDQEAALAALARSFARRARRRSSPSSARPGRRRRRTSSVRSAPRTFRRSGPRGASTTRSACRSRSAGSSPRRRVLVTEMGMRGLGQIAALCEIARPSVVVVSHIGPEHLELLGSVERVAEANAEAIEWLPPGGTAVVPASAYALEPFLTRDDVDASAVPRRRGRAA